MAKSATFTADQLNRADEATERWQIDLLLQSAPFARDTALAFALAAGADEIAVVDINEAQNRQKFSLATQTCEQLVFTPVEPYRIAHCRLILGLRGC